MLDTPPAYGLLSPERLLTAHGLCTLELLSFLLAAVGTPTQAERSATAST